MRELETGSVIGNYRVVRMLGQGGMGTVYEVEHIELGTHYALKTYTFDSESDVSDVLKRKFLEEGKLLARLKHPNLTHVFDLGFEEKTQMPYFVMDLVTYADGGTYTVEDIDLKGIDEDMVYDWFTQLASALDYIHGEGIVHRDIKPSNLLVDKDLNIVLTDFGISRVFGSKIKSEVKAENTMVAKTGRGKIVLGTHHYIAPEVEEGEEATPKADAYSLGVMLLRWLTGFYYGDNPGAITLLTRKKYRWLNVISRLLAPADRRPEKYTPLLEMLKPTEVAAPAPLLVQPARKAVSRAKVDVVAIVARSIVVFVFLGLLGVGAWQFWQRYEADKQRQQKQVEELRRKKEADKAERERLAAEQAEEKPPESSTPSEKPPEPSTPSTPKPPEPFTPTEKPLEPSTPSTPKPPEPSTPSEKPLEPSTPSTPKPLEPSTPSTPKPPEPSTPSTPKQPKEKPKGGNQQLPQKGASQPNRKKGMTISKDMTISMECGEKMEFCLIPEGKFKMSNLDGQGTHEVTLEKPYWITQYCITTKQWRDYKRDDFNDPICREVENEFGQNPIYPVSSKFSWNAFCEHLNEKYSSELPEGYVFRLPTEAEWERVCVTSRKVNIMKLRNSFEKKHTSDFRKRAEAFKKRAKFVKEKDIEDTGIIRYGPPGSMFFVGRRSNPEGRNFYVCDINVPGGVIVFDEYEAFPDPQSHLVDLKRYLVYKDGEHDPVKWDGLRNNYCLKRYFEDRFPVLRDNLAFAHIVIAPVLEVVERVRAEESSPYLHTAFGGVLLSDRIKDMCLSSTNMVGPVQFNTPERWALVVSNESVIVRERGGDDLRGCCTIEKDESPWVQLTLESAMTITGVQIDVFRSQMHTEHLRIWTSEDGKNWSEVAKDDVVRSRYKFDLSGKDVKAKYIRIGREPGFKPDWFAVNKILVYGKK